MRCVFLQNDNFMCVHAHARKNGTELHVRKRLNYGCWLGDNLEITTNNKIIQRKKMVYLSTYDGGQLIEFAFGLSHLISKS